MRGNRRSGDLLERLVLLRDCYPMRSAYDCEPVIGVEAVISCAELLFRETAREHDPPQFGWFRRAA